MSEQLNLKERLHKRSDLDCRKAAERLDQLEKVLWHFVTARTKKVEIETKRLTNLVSILQDDK